MVKIKVMKWQKELKGMHAMHWFCLGAPVGSLGHNQHPEHNQRNRPLFSDHIRSARLLSWSGNDTRATGGEADVFPGEQGEHMD